MSGCIYFTEGGLHEWMCKLDGGGNSLRFSNGWLFGGGVYISVGVFFDFQVWMILVIHVLGGNRGSTVADEGGWHALEVGNSGVGSSEASVTTS